MSIDPYSCTTPESVHGALLCGSFGPLTLEEQQFLAEWVATNEPAEYIAAGVEEEAEDLVTTEV